MCTCSVSPSGQVTDRRPASDSRTRCRREMSRDTRQDCASTPPTTPATTPPTPPTPPEPTSAATWTAAPTTAFTSSTPVGSPRTAVRWLLVAAMYLAIIVRPTDATTSGGATTTTTTTTATGWDWKGGASIDLLSELAPVRFNLTGVDVASGPFSISPALYFTGDVRNVRLAEPSYAKVMTLLQSHHDITFVAAVRQEPFNVGTLFSLSQGFTRFLELQSSGRKDEIRLHYTHAGEARVETFNHRLADGAWHRLAVTVSGGVVSLYVDCVRVERRIMSAVPDASLPASTQDDLDGEMAVWIGQRGDQHFLFKGAMQDVRLVAGSNGHLTQCPAAEADCPTCGEFQNLRSVVARLEKSLQQLTDKLEDAEERISQLEQCDCPRSCSVNATVYADGATWQSDCDVCSCEKGQVTCKPVQCPKITCRNPTLLPGECCLTCLKKCFFHGMWFDHGERYSPRHCHECQCLNGSMHCRPLDPELHCPVLTCPPSEQFTVAGECCKQCPGVDFCAGNDCHERAQCINLKTTFACHCQPGFTGDGKQCRDINECEAESGPDANQCGANAACVNTPGSYECRCKDGFVALDNYTCADQDECSTGVHDCHPTRASCLNTPGSYQCQCRPGYQGDGVNCEPVCDEPCQNGGRCVAPGRCACRRGFHGDRCELDVDECDPASHDGANLCHPNSECRNMPGFYVCSCKPGFRSAQQDTHNGALCLDVDECAEGLHSCHGNTQCLNTVGSYECRCPPHHPNCSLTCATSDGVFQSGQTWTPHKSPCITCSCQDGVVTCSKLPCHCDSPDAKRPHSDQCCPHCREQTHEKRCKHQKTNVTYHSGQRWIYQCQSCECLHGETDCWPMECPPVYCSHPVRLPGDCCLRCPENDPCSAPDEPISLTGPGNSSASPPLGCHFQGFNYSEGAEWTAGADGCNNCKCKGGHVCCRYDPRCSKSSPGPDRRIVHQPPEGQPAPSKNVADESIRPSRTRIKASTGKHQGKGNSINGDSNANKELGAQSGPPWRQRVARAARVVRSSNVKLRPALESSSSLSNGSNPVPDDRETGTVLSQQDRPSRHSGPT